MSREVRRVPVGWRHPVEHNPHWRYQRSLGRRSHPPSQLHAENEQFVALHKTPVSQAQSEWDKDRKQWEDGNHEHLAWLLKYYSADGYVGRDGKRAVIPYTVYAEDEETVIRRFHPVTADQIVAVYPYSEYAGDRPTADTHMPDFDVPADELGWCLYQTVSEGTPVTPVFPTAQGLIEHLSTVGQDWDQISMRSSAAEALVRQGHSMGSMVAVGGTLLRSDMDADLIETLPRVDP